MIQTLMLFLFIPLLAHAGWSEKAKTYLPKTVQSIIVQKTDRDTARKMLGKPDLVKGEKEYWAIDGFKYALELSFSNKKVSSVHYNFSPARFSVEELKGSIDPKLLKASPSSPHTTLVYEDKEGKMEVDLSTGKVESVRFP